MNVIDRVVGFFNPEAGLRRSLARVQTHEVMNYDAATRGRRAYGWKAPASAADASAYGSRARLRQLSRDMIRNRAYAARAKDVVVANVVGEGVSPSVRSDDADTKVTVEDLIRRHLLTNDLDSLGEYDLFEMQQICMTSVFSDGEVLLRRRLRNTQYDRHLTLPFQIELVEVDCLDTTIQSWGDNLVIEGIEYGPTGAIEAYHLYNEHPGAVRHRKAFESTRVHWSDIIHLRRFDRPGQLRGVPWLAPVMMTLGEISDYQEAQILKQRMSSLMAIVLKYLTGAPRPAKAGAGLEELAPGAVVELPEGAEPVVVQPPTVEGYDEFMTVALRTIAVGIGITHEALTGNLRQVNFSSARMGRSEMDRLVRMWQRGLIIAQMGVGIERWLRDGIRMLRLNHDLDFRLDWTPPRRIMVDPTREIPSMIEEVEAGLNSRQGVQRELGRDPERIREERKQDMVADQAAGLPSPDQSSAGTTTPLPPDTGAHADEKEEIDENGT
ncbi:phage portal protein [Paracoccus aminophilus]|uniref:Phage portal protein n=1 Tax=Paracoccus aminophilus JCM 7686 TaxID=1367847 RepID=S5XWV0_PARAH|nr:phage portal protein [Paracoccus aminophilus]AGT07900.1 phage portal protein [Paracoccus aminophilus JCM 7686]